MPRELKAGYTSVWAALHIQRLIDSGSDSGQRNWRRSTISALIWASSYSRASAPEPIESPRDRVKCLTARSGVWFFGLSLFRETHFKETQPLLGIM